MGRKVIEKKGSKNMTLVEALEYCISTYTDENGVLSPSLNDVSLDEAIGEVFATYQNDWRDCSIEMETVFDSPGYSTGYISVAWITPDMELCHDTSRWEVI